VVVAAGAKFLDGDSALAPDAQHDVRLFLFHVTQPMCA
jgi:hypothetical protein